MPKLSSAKVALASDGWMDYNINWFALHPYWRMKWMMNRKNENQNPVVFYLWVLLYMLCALVVRVVTFLPLLALAQDSVRWLALLCPVMLVFLVLPLRYSFAEALVQEDGQRRFCFAKAFSFAHYGEKLTESILHAVRVLLWGIPLAALAVYAMYWYNEVDALTLLQSITALGAGWASLRVGVINFFGGDAVAPVNTMMDGMFVIAMVVVLAVIIWLYGAVRNSASRYSWVLATRNDRAPRKELRRRLIGRRWKQLGVAVINLLLWVPFVVVLALTLKSAVSDLSTMLMMAITTGKLPAVDLAGAVLPLAAAFFGLYMTLLPVRRMLTAAFVARGKVTAEKANVA